MLTEYFVASPSELSDLDIRTGPGDHFRAFKSKAVDTVNLRSLQRILAKDLHQPDIAGLKCSVVGNPTAQGPWVFAVPDRLVDLLAAVSEPAISRLGASWAETPEWRLDRVGSSALADVVKELSALALHARAQNQHMFLWMSL